jgi:hypothetical protein
VLPALADLEKLSPEVKAETLRIAAAELWRRGELGYKLHSTQHRIVDALQKSTRRKFFLLCSRRIGKTFTLLCDAFQVAIKKPGARILYLAPQANMANEIVADGLKPILADLPSWLKIEVKPHIKEIHFPNGSIIRLKGVNSEHADALRGGAQDRVYIDEAGQVDNLSYVLSSIVMPMTMTMPNAKIILATTPAISPSHDSTAIYQDLRDSGDAIKFTLLDVPDDHVAHDIKVEYLLEAKEKKEDIADILAGKKPPQTTTALREYFCEFVTDASKAVVPEMREAEQHIVRVHPRPPQFDAYVSVDPGFSDRTGLVFAIYDFRAGLISVEDEDLLFRASTNDVGKSLLEKEYALWGDQVPYLRVVDDDLRMIADLHERHGLAFVAAQKQDSLGAINLLRSMISNREIVISPKCRRLVEQLKEAVWNKNSSDFARTVDGHFDLVAALKYLVRSVNRHRNLGGQGRPPVGGFDGKWYSPRRRFWGAGPGQQQLDLLGDTPIARRLKKRT